MSQYVITVPEKITVDADTPEDAWAKLARFFGKLSDGLIGDHADMAGLSLSGTAVTLAPTEMPLTATEPHPEA